MTATASRWRSLGLLALALIAVPAGLATIST